MIGGIDLGGTKIEARAFDLSASEVARNRIATPTESYHALLDGLTAQFQWLLDQGEMQEIGLGCPGLIHPQTGVMLTANLPATGHRLAADLEDRVGRPVALINDCRAASLAEALLGAGQNVRNLVGLNIGTGVAGGQVIDGRLIPDKNGQHAEYGHLPLPAELVAKYDLPLVQCGCGLTGCFETYIAGPGLVRLALIKTGETLTTQELMLAPEYEDIRLIWYALVAELIAIIARTADPDRIVLFGGLGMLSDVPTQIGLAMTGRILAGTEPPEIVQAMHGDASGALGAALFAQQMGRDMT